MTSNSNAPIGIFDSGIGGLTVVKAVREELPGEDLIYLGDTARVPYGIKSEDTVRQYALQITDFLLAKGVKMILVACNTVSATAHEAIIERANGIPVLDVITAGTSAALEQPHPHNHIGVIGTLATVGSGAYQRFIQGQSHEVNVTAKACPMLVPLAEEGWTDNDIARLTVSEYLAELKQSDLDTLILGCTHYPLFHQTIQEEMGGNLRIVDSAVSIARMARQKLEEQGMLRPNGPGKFDCYVTDKPQRFQELAERFLGHQIEDVKIVHLS